MNGAIETCAFCPKLCRHVCPVAVGTSLESTTPTAIMNEVMLAITTPDIENSGVDAINLCTRCGQCSDFCGVDQSVVTLLDEARAQLEPPPPPWSEPVIIGHHQTVAIICGQVEWSKPLSTLTGQKMATMVTPDHLGELHRIRPDTRDEVIEKIGRLMQGKTAVTSCNTCREALELANVSTETIVMVSQLVPPLPTWRTCHCEPGPSVNTVIKCCGARAPLVTAKPKIANKIAEEVARRLDGQAIFVPDTRCAEHLRNAGVHALGPIDTLLDTED